jgi:hypothetical protein
MPGRAPGVPLDANSSATLEPKKRKKGVMNNAVRGLLAGAIAIMAVAAVTAIAPAGATAAKQEQILPDPCMRETFPPKRALTVSITVAPPSERGLQCPIYEAPRS